MKYLQDYMTERQNKAIDEAGAFFAFSNKQFDEVKKDGIKYVDVGGGLICNKETADKLAKELKTIYNNSIKQDVKENGLSKIVLRELNNHEAYYSGNTESTCEALDDYPVTKEQILKVFRNKNFVIATGKETK